MIPAPLRYRDFRSVFFAGLVSTFGDFFVPIAISFAVLDLTGSASDLGLVLFARILGQVLLFLAGGVWADRFPRQHVPAASGLTPQLVPPEQLQAANGLMYLTLSIGGITGPAVGGILVATSGAGWAILGDAVTFAIAAVLLVRIPPLGFVERPRESFWR